MTYNVFSGTLNPTQSQTQEKKLKTDDRGSRGKWLLSGDGEMVVWLGLTEGYCCLQASESRTTASDDPFSGVCLWMKKGVWCPGMGWRAACTRPTVFKVKTTDHKNTWSRQK